MDYRTRALLPLRACARASLRAAIAIVAVIAIAVVVVSGRMHPHQQQQVKHEHEHEHEQQQQQSPQEQPRRMTGNPHAGALPRDHHHQHQHHQQQIQHRRALMHQHHHQQQQQHMQQDLLPSPYATNPMQQQQHHQQQQSQPSYLAMNANLGLTMNMNDMESSIRAYHPMQQHQQHQHVQQQQQQQQHIGAPPPDSASMYWRPQSGMVVDSTAYSKPSGLEMEFNDIIAQTNNSTSASSGPVPGALESSSSSQRTSDMSMTAMSASFDVFSDHTGMSNSGSLRPSYHMPSQLALHAMRSRTSPRDALPVSGVVSVLSPAAVGVGSRSDLDPDVVGRLRRSSSVASTTSGGGGHDSNVSESSSIASSTASAALTDYSQFVEAREEPDLRQQKLDTKSETCQFHNCPNRARVVQAYGKFCNRHVIVAPCGFPGCRDRANVHASMCEKHLAEGKEALHRVLANRAQNVPVCRTFGCFKNDQGRGYCRGHEKLLMATGRLPKHINKRRLNSAYTMCSYPGCNKHSQRHHLCRTHGNLIAKQAEELHARSTTDETYDEVLARLQKDVRKCTHPSCTKNSQRDRLCTIHYYERHNLQRDGSVGPSADAASAGEGTEATDLVQSTEAGAETACSVADCSALATVKGTCRFHATSDLSSIGTAASSGTKSPGVASSSSNASGGSASGIRAVERTRCSVLGCGQASYASGLCMAHLKHQQQQQTHGPSGATGRYSSTLSPFSDDRFSASLIDGAANSRSGIDSSYFPGSSNASSYSGALDPSSLAANNFAVVGPLGRQLVSGAAPPATLSSHQHQHRQGRSYAMQHPSSNASSGLARTSTGAGTCSNPMCARDAFGREYCESCQSMFAPLVVSVGDSLASAQAPASYSFGSSSAQPEPESSPQAWTNNNSSTNMTSSHGKRSPATGGGLALAGKGTSTCRVSNCNASGPHGGLCEQHFRAFEDGGLSVDELTLRSRQLTQQQQQQEQQAQQSHAAASKSSPNDSSSKLRKYFCKLDGCGKQAQRRGLCKRHYRQHEDATSSAMPGAGAALASVVASAMACRFPGCSQPVGGSSAALCLGHANASACWTPGCELIVDGPQFCASHALHQQCAYENCSFPALRDGGGGCSHHMMERRCSHAHCDKFTVGAGDRCRLHQISCSEEPCTLCELHGLETEASVEHRMAPSLPPPPMQQPLVFASALGLASRRANAENYPGNSSSSGASASYRDARML